jgi:hypothetical protein
MNYTHKHKATTSKPTPQNFQQAYNKEQNTQNNTVLNWISILTIKFAPIIILTISLILKHIIVVDDDFITNEIDHRTHVTISGLSYDCLNTFRLWTNNLAEDV